MTQGLIEIALHCRPAVARDGHADEHGAVLVLPI
jgi:hypothetical protein